MRVSVDIHRHDFATVVFTPSLVERLIGKRSREHCVFWNGRAWSWLTGAVVEDLRVLRAIERALVERIKARIARAAQATAPPS